MAEKNQFEQLFNLNVNAKTEKKGNLTYLSWSWAWGEFCKVYPDATYEIKHWDGKPYLFEEGVGYMVETSVTVGEITRSMWLPVMDFKNKAMLQASMTDINKAIMRCLTKNIAMFGLGLYIYSGEDLPEDEGFGKEEKKKSDPVKAQKELTGNTPMTKKEIEILRKTFESDGVDESKVCAFLKIDKLESINGSQYNNVLTHMEDVKAKCSK